MKWLQALEERATQHHDLRALGDAHFEAGYDILAPRGDLHGAISRQGQALELFARIGDAKQQGLCLMEMGEAFLSLGDLQKAEEYADRALETAKMLGNKLCIGRSYWIIGSISLCQDAWEKAVDAFQKTVQLFRESGMPWHEAWAAYLLGRAYLAQEDRVEALNRFQEAVALVGPTEFRGYLLLPPRILTPNPFVASALSGLEEGHEVPQHFAPFVVASERNIPKLATGHSSNGSWSRPNPEGILDC